MAVSATVFTDPWRAPSRSEPYLHTHTRLTPAQHTLPVSFHVIRLAPPPPAFNHHPCQAHPAMHVRPPKPSRDTRPHAQSHHDREPAAMKRPLPSQQPHLQHPKHTVTSTTGHRTPSPSHTDVETPVSHSRESAASRVTARGTPLGRGRRNVIR